MTLAIEHDRPAQFLAAADPTLDFEAAQARLERACLRLTFGEAGETAWGQAALLTIVRAAARMFRGGVYLDAGEPFEAVLRLEPRGDLRRRLCALGARDGRPPPHALHLHVGLDAPAGVRLVCSADGWSALAGPPELQLSARPGNEISGALAGAMGVAEAFRVGVLGDLRAGRQLKHMSAWGPDAPEDVRILYLPRSLWLLGLGNLGQAVLSVLGLLPYADGADLELVLQDFDVAAPENLAVQVLTQPKWLGCRKTRGASAWAEGRGLTTRIVETAFSPTSRPGADDPTILLAGLDNLDARRWAADAGFGLVLDAGLGAGSADAFDLRLHGFPGARTAAEAWPEVSDAAAPPVLNRALRKAVEQGRLDDCGAMTIAGKSVGVPCTALAAAAVQLGQLCRALAEGRCCDLVDASLADTQPGVFKVMGQDLGPLAFVNAAPGG